MPNVTLTHKTPYSEINKTELVKKAWTYIRAGFSKKEAFRKAWETVNLTVTFWTSAKPEDIQWTIKTCQKDGFVRQDLLRKWDADRIQHPLDWVSYHLRRNGFHIESDLKNVYSVAYTIPKLDLYDRIKG